VQTRQQDQGVKAKFEGLSMGLADLRLIGMKPKLVRERSEAISCLAQGKPKSQQSCALRDDKSVSLMSWLFLCLLFASFSSAASNLSAALYLCSQLARGYGMALTESCSPNVDQIETYTFDAAGNRKTEVVKNLANVVLVNKTYTYNNREQLLSVVDAVNSTTTAYLYDANGNQTSVKVGVAPATIYIWGPRDLLASLSTGAAYEYDSAGHRTAININQTRTQFVWQGDELVAETNILGSSLSQYTRAGSMLLGEVRNGVAQHFDQDGFNSIMLATNADMTIAGRLSYRAYGAVRTTIGAIASPFRFNGYVSDGGDELSSPSRYYSLGTGRFTSMDPAEPTQMDPMSWNAYVGLNSNPMRYLDPTGRESTGKILENAELNADSALGAFGYRFLANFYKAGSLGFAAVHDPARDAYDEGRISEGQYHAATAAAFVLPVATIATAGLGSGAVAAATTFVGRSAVIGGLGAGFGGASDAYTQGALMATGVQAEYSIEQTVNATAQGAVFGVVTHGLAVGGANVVNKVLNATRGVQAAAAITIGTSTTPMVAAEGAGMSISRVVPSRESKINIEYSRTETVLPTAKYASVRVSADGVPLFEQAPDINLAPPPAVTNKFPGDPLSREGAIYAEPKIVDGNIKVPGKGGIEDVDFVITQDGRLVLGKKHATLAANEDVSAAGQLVLRGDGKVKVIDNLSGHYRPTVAEARRFPALFKSLGINLNKTRLNAFEFTVNKNNLVTNKKLTVNEEIK
jgi:RHS repeat-associated protein